MAATLSTPEPRQTTTPPRTARLAWLDALRGFAALVVVLEHTLDPVLPELRSMIAPWFSLGWFGVVLFFLVSGYVVPASLERRGDLKAFWIARLFRLHPLFLLASAGALFLAATGFTRLASDISDHPVRAAVAHLTMLHDMLGVPSIINVFWTLSYEMIFYLLVTALYVWGLHRRSAGIATSMGAAAVILGAALPSAWLSSRAVTPTIAVAAAVLVTGLTLVILGARRAGASLLGVLALTLLLINGRAGTWESLIILATMFAGTALYRIEQGQLPRRALALVALVPILAISANIRLSAQWGYTPDTLTSYRWSYCLPVLAAWLTFAAGWRLRHSAFPVWLPALGMISYSLYLLHPLPVQVASDLIGDPHSINLPGRLLCLSVLVALVIALAGFTYRYIEKPMQRLGRNLSRSDTRPRGPL